MARKCPDGHFDDEARPDERNLPGRQPHILRCGQVETGRFLGRVRWEGNCGIESSDLQPHPGSISVASSSSRQVRTIARQPSHLAASHPRTSTACRPVRAARIFPGALREAAARSSHSRRQAVRTASPTTSARTRDPKSACRCGSPSRPARLTRPTTSAASRTCSSTWRSTARRTSSRASWSPTSNRSAWHSARTSTRTRATTRRSTCSTCRPIAPARSTTACRRSAISRAA